MVNNDQSTTRYPKFNGVWRKRISSNERMVNTGIKDKKNLTTVETQTIIKSSMINKHLFISSWTDIQV